MTKREEEVLELISENPMISQKECADKLGISRSAIAGHIMNLTDKGYISGKGYILKEEPYVLVIGGSNMDISGTPKGSFIQKDSNPGKVSLSPGGVGRNIAENLARMGSTVKLLTVLGEDLYGRQLLETCRYAGIDMNHVKISGKKGTSVYLSILNEMGDMISAISDMSLMEELDREYLEKNHRTISAASLVIIDANLSETVIEFIVTKYGDKKIFVDTVSTAKAQKIIPFIGKFHTAKPNKLEAEILSGIKINSEKSIKIASGILIDKGLNRVFLSMGEKGIYYRDRKNSLHYQGEQIKAVNTTGAGDAYTAALAHSFMKNFTPEKTLAFAAAASKMAIRCSDTINRDITSEKIEEMIKGEI
ncbi:MAG: PfkB family carbohydrate kinase [Spirochaetaceae bacterium]|jgi:pseudouridine kinase|nr:PfkB family carbohydrate kinase [Spirochaetaceae bacterium]